MTRVFVFEYLSGGGRLDGDEAATLLPQGLAMRDAIVADLLPRDAGADGDDCEVTVAACPATTSVPRGAAAVQARPGETLLEFVARQAAKHDAAWIVAPETEGWLAAFEGVVGSGWLGCSAEAIAIASSKSATLARLAAHGVATPLALAAAACAWVVKPDDGAGAVATRQHRTLAAAQADHAARAHTCLEPWVDGDALSLSLLAHDGDAELLSVNRQRIDVDDGRVDYRGVEIDVMAHGDARWPALAALARRVAAAVPGLRGFVGIDLVWHAQRGPVVIEINPRTTCAFVGLSGRLGRRLGAEIVAAARRPESVDG